MRACGQGGADRCGAAAHGETDANPGGLPKSVFDDLQAQLPANRSVFYRDFASGPFYGFNRPGVESSEANIKNWWRQGMMGGAKADYDGIVAFSQTDFTEDVKKMTVPVLVMHGDDDQIVPYADSGHCPRARVERDAEDVQRIPGRLRDHGRRHDHADLLAFVQCCTELVVGVGSVAGPRARPLRKQPFQ